MIGILLFFSDNVFAQGAGTIATEGSKTDSIADALFNGMWSLLNILYMITLPVLIIAGKAMDNSMVYGEFMNLDKPLYMLWNMSRTLANFAIGWVLLWKIFNYIFSKETGTPAILKDIIIRWTLIVLWINFSWFGLWVLIDLSTVATYTLGAMPLWAIKEINKDKDMPILSIMSFFDYQSTNSKAQAGIQKNIPPYIYYKRWNINIPPCAKNYHGFIIWPEYYPTLPNKTDVSFTGRKKDDTSKQYCALTPQTLADITNLEKRKTENLSAIAPIENNKERNWKMKDVINSLMNSTSCNTNITLTGTAGGTHIIAANNIQQLWLSWTLQFGDGQKTSYTFCSTAANSNDKLTITHNAYNNNDRTKVFLKGGEEPYSTEESQTLNNLVNQSQGMVGPFVTLYMTLLDFSNLSTINQDNLSLQNSIGGFTEFLLKSAISVAVFIPLVALAATLIIRVVLLRAIIAFVPLGIVFWWLGKDIPWGWGWSIKLPGVLWWASIDSKNAGSSIIWLIFAPVLPVFAISISLIILQTLQLEMWKAISTENKGRQFFWIQSVVSTTDPNISCIDFWGMQETCYKTDPNTDSGSWFANLIPWLFVNIFGIWLMWMMVKVSLSSSSITKGIGENIINLWTKALWAIPIPGLTIGWTKISTSTALQAPSMLTRIANQWIDEKLAKENKAIYDKFDNNDSNANTNWSPSVIITKPKETKEAFIKQAAQKNNNYIQAFSTSLKESWDIKAAENLSKLSIADQSQETLKFLESFEKEQQDKINKNNLNIQKDNLIKQILEPQLKAIYDEKDENTKKNLLDNLKTQIENTDNKLWWADKAKSLFSTNPTYSDILNKLFSTNRNSTTGQQNTPQQNPTS